jgi:hypothetical protein
VTNSRRLACLLLSAVSVACAQRDLHAIGFRSPPRSADRGQQRSRQSGASQSGCHWSRGGSEPWQPRFWISNRRHHQRPPDRHDYQPECTSIVMGDISATDDFILSANNCPATLGPAKSCAIQVEFAPDETGAATGTVYISDEDPASPQKVSLGGTGK